MEERKQAVRIQTSILNGLEKKALVWMAERMPRWVNSDMLTAVGTIGSAIICAGYILCNLNINFLWMASLGFVINWFGDSLDGTLARVRNQQRPRYGFFVDHNMDCLNEVMMFFGLGLSPFMDFRLGLFVLVAYLLLSIYVFINSHIKGEFKLTYAKLGPTELRVLAIIANMILLYVTPIREFRHEMHFFGIDYALSALDCIAIVVLVAVLITYFFNFIRDAKEYSKMEPLPRDDS